MCARLLAAALLSFLLVAAQDTEKKAGDGTEKEGLTKEVFFQKINEEKRFLIDSWEFVDKMTHGFVDKMKEFVQVSMLKDLNQEMYAALEVAEDTLIAAEEAGVLAMDCVSQLEQRAHTMVDENIERMRLCVEDEAADGARLREDVREAVDAAASSVLVVQRKLLDCVEKSEKSDPSLKEFEHMKGCLLKSEVLKLMKEKEVVDKEVDKQMQRAYQKREKGNRCLADVMEQAREDYSQLKTQIRACAEPVPKMEL